MSTRRKPIADTNGNIVTRSTRNRPSKNAADITTPTASPAKSRGRAEPKKDKLIDTSAADIDNNQKVDTEIVKELETKIPDDVKEVENISDSTQVAGDSEVIEGEVTPLETSSSVQESDDTGEKSQVTAPAEESKGEKSLDLDPKDLTDNIADQPTPEMQDSKKDEPIQDSTATVKEMGDTPVTEPLKEGTTNEIQTADTAVKELLQGDITNEIQTADTAVKELLQGDITNEIESLEMEVDVEQILAKEEDINVEDDGEISDGEFPTSGNLLMVADVGNLTITPSGLSHRPSSNRGSTIDEKTCEFCGVVKRTPADLLRHLRKHTGERPYQCTKCDAKFKAKRSLQYHELQHHSGSSIISDNSTDLTLLKKRTIDEMANSSLETTPAEKRFKPDQSSSSLADAGSFSAGKEPSTSPESGMEGDLSYTASFMTSDRVCQFCGKACNKPSDLKRHLMSHTGERPFACNLCGKQFRAKNSMLYHQKAAHGMNIELTKGLQERYMKLQRSTRKFKRREQYIRVDNNINNLNVDNNSNDSTNNSNDSFPVEKSSFNQTLHSTPINSPATTITNRVMYSSNTSVVNEGVSELDENTGLFKSRMMDGKMVEDKGSPIHVTPPDFSSIIKHGPSLVGSEIHVESQFTKSRISIKNETVLVTRLDGVNLNNNKETSIYKCYLCGKIFTNLSKVQCHLSMHFEKDIVVYKCQLCKASFWLKHQVLQHIRNKHQDMVKSNAKESSPELEEIISPVNQSGDIEDTEASSSDSGIHTQVDSSKREEDEDSMMDDLVDDGDEDEDLCRYWCGLKYKKNSNGSYVCMQCRKSFHREISLLKHIKIHTNQRSLYCKECGKGFSEQTRLRQHLALVHGKTENPIKSPVKSSTMHSVLSHLLQNKQMETPTKEVSLDSAEKARKLLIQEGLQEDVTVVMPCGPEDELEMDSGVGMKMETSWSGKDSDDSNDGHGIMSAPKLSLIPDATQALAAKSKRKSTQPVKLNNSQDKSVPVTAQLSVAVPNIGGVAIKQEPLSPKLTTLTTTPSAVTAPVTKVAAVPSTVTSQTPTAANPQIAQFLMAPNQMMNTGLGSFILTPSGSLAGGSSQPTMILSNAAFQMPGGGTFQLPTGGGAIQTLTASGGSIQIPTGSGGSIQIPTGSGGGTFQLPGGGAIQIPSSGGAIHIPNMTGGGTAIQMTGAPTIGGMPGFVGMPISLRVQSGDNITTTASKEVSTSTPDKGQTVETSPSTNTPGSHDKSSEREELVGYPRVQWSPNDSESPDSRSKSPTMWSNVSTTADGRKVTSLSRTHSRLPIVNAPVNREQVCKPTTLDDGRQVYRCPFCSKDFLSYSDINRHMDFHEDIRPYKCKYCDYYARTNSQLKVHMMRHQGIREFCCKVCAYKGVTQSDLNRHTKSQIHLLKIQNECSHCGEGFVTEKNLERHQNGNCIIKMQVGLDLDEEDLILSEVKQEVVELDD